MKNSFLYIIVICVSAFAQCGADYLREIAAKDSVVRAAFTQTKRIKSLDKPVVSQGTVLAVKNKGVVWITNTPAYLKKVISFERETAAGTYYSAIYSLLSGDFSGLQKRFDCKLSSGDDLWTIEITPKSGVLKRNIKYIGVSGTQDGGIIKNVSIFSTDESGVNIDFAAQTPTNQFLSEEEEALFDVE